MQAQDHAARFGPEVVDLIGEGLAWRKAEEIRLQTGDPHGAFGHVCP
jgi:hypothetical protein